MVASSAVPSCGYLFSAIGSQSTLLGSNVAT
jgi:hypothetical protein